MYQANRLVLFRNGDKTMIYTVLIAASLVPVGMVVALIYVVMECLERVFERRSQKMVRIIFLLFKYLAIAIQWSAAAGTAISFAKDYTFLAVLAYYGAPAWSFIITYEIMRRRLGLRYIV
jgi:hypothetical protein